MGKGPLGLLKLHLKTFISLLNYIEIFQCIETLLGFEHIYIYRSKEGKGWGRINKSK